MDAQQQLQANRLDYNQAEIERRDKEMANMEQTVDGVSGVVDLSHLLIATAFSCLRSGEYGAALRACVLC